jgi:V8-like Glu-specific endopeptidase
MLVIGTVSLFAACNENGGPAEGFDVDQFMIHGGALPNEPFHTSAVALTTFFKPKANIFCSGVLIEDDVVMTAAHCLDEAAFGAVYNEVEPTDIKVGFGTWAKGILADMVYVTVSDVEINSGYDRTGFGINDVGLIRLTNVAPVGFDPIPAVPAALGFVDPADVGDTINATGFGENNTPDKPFTKLQIDLTISDLDPQTFDYSNAVGGTCFGDSGGPDYWTASDGNTYVAGIHSYITWNGFDCSAPGAVGTSSRVDQFETFIAGF